MTNIIIFPIGFFLAILNAHKDWAYSEMVSRIHGMDEAGVRFSVGPLLSRWLGVETIRFFCKIDKLDQIP